MSAETLRSAARLMRERAKGATPGPWAVEGQGPGPDSVNMGCGVVWTQHDRLFGGDIAMPAGDMYPRSGYSPMEDMTHIASWHPVVALAVADWLDHSAHHAEVREENGTPSSESADPRALRVAKAYLGEKVDDD